MLEDDTLVVLGAVVRLGPLADEAAKVIGRDDLAGIEGGEEAPVGVGEPAPRARAAGVSARRPPGPP